MLSSLGYIKNLTIDRPLSKFEHTMLDDILSNPSTRGISIHADGCLFALFSWDAKIKKIKNERLKKMKKDL